MSADVVTNEAEIAAALFGDNPRVFCDIAEWDGEPAGFALWFYNFSTFRGRHGIYLEDLFVRPAISRPWPRQGAAGKPRQALRGAKAARALEWAVLDWNTPSIEFYESLGARHSKGWYPYRLTGAALAKLGEG